MWMRIFPCVSPCFSLSRLSRRRGYTLSLSRNAPFPVPFTLSPCFLLTPILCNSFILNTNCSHTSHNIRNAKSEDDMPINLQGVNQLWPNIPYFLA